MKKTCLVSQTLSKKAHECGDLRSKSMTGTAGRCLLCLWSTAMKIKENPALKRADVRPAEPQHSPIQRRFVGSKARNGSPSRRHCDGSRLICKLVAWDLSCKVSLLPALVLLVRCTLDALSACSVSMVACVHAHLLLPRFLEIHGSNSHHLRFLAIHSWMKHWHAAAWLPHKGVHHQQHEPASEIVTPFAHGQKRHWCKYQVGTQSSTDCPSS